LRVELRATGGIGKFSDALVVLGTQALREPGALYLVPEWGFMMPLAFLAGRAIDLAPTVDAPEVRRRLCSGRRVVSLHWAGVDLQDRIDALRAQLGGAVLAGQWPYRQRDGTLAFVVAVYAPTAEAGWCPPS
jgi:hypothetical protein